VNKAIVVGSGIAGIASSIRLAKKGYSVKVFESNLYPGGKLHAFKNSGYRFDAGPSLFTMPHMVDELFELCGENPKDHFSYIKKKIACNYFWEDGISLTAYGNKEDFLKEVENKLKVPKEKLINYFERSKKKYDLTAPLFLEKSLHKLDTFFSKETISAILSFGKYDIFKTLHEVNKEMLEEPHLIQLFDRFATYNGSSPYQTSGMMSLINHLEQHYGTFLPKGGMVSITKSLYELAKRQGVEFIFNSYVDKIVIKNKKAQGIECKGNFYDSDIVISNMDVNPTYKLLMTNEIKPKNIIDSESSSSAVIFYWGISREFKELDLHNIFFSENYFNEFESIFNHNKISKDPTVYINITSKDIPEDAPSNSENWFVMINTPADKGQDWNSIVNEIRKNVISKISRNLNIDISKYIETEEILTPKIIQSKTQSHKGALYGPSSNKMLSAFFRHPNFSRKIDNLFFCGGSVHPGGGIPLCLLSAKITSDLVKNL
tara:strand:+ start:14417 stop:15883 length:1467 start_codon:yes stop_codon:yes gene_type:complete